ncbi:FAD-binding oxidoreductase [Sulfuracidifex metallicus]|uniref:FAD-binding protein n=1 Tax=Sulfuracidifex metallicus DSM 6482 = JCM 9184 TaxID=523847 RepID=A0A6A9QLU2_SULME|nr:FAD-binding oxidoreductase [Sulfuracidifex metallicus]MUN29119.1 FAD-binding protein [Sulfuracidifex metallicus DSM 6482 = JCM 9184]WOE50360.1 FAD-binding oxidoreductase [Sulfuracidifex metallicus DSM 6482 = JCM 9184]
MNNFLSSKLSREVKVIDDPKVVAEKSRDFSHTSPFLLEKMKKHKADVVVLPQSEEDVLKVVELALEEHIPLVPRAGGRNNVGGVIPLKGGIIVDLSYLTSLSVDNNEVIAGAGSLFSQEGKLLFSPRVYPSTFSEGATVGGFFSGGSGGIGEFKYGRNWDHVLEVRMVNPRGKMTTLRGGDVKVAAHAEGTTGIVTRLRLMTRKNDNDVPIMLEFDSLKESLNFVESLFDGDYPIYHVTLRSPQMSKLSENITGVSTNKWNLMVVCEGECPFHGNLKAGAKVWEKRFLFFGGTITTAMGAYKRRMYYMVKDIPLEETLEKLTKVSETDAMIADVEFDVGRSSHPFVLTDSPSTYKQVGEILGGTNFDLNSIRINDRLKPDHLHRIMWYKRAYDKEDLFNPGKVEI